MTPGSLRSSHRERTSSLYSEDARSRLILNSFLPMPCASYQAIVIAAVPHVRRLLANVGHGSAPTQVSVQRQDANLGRRSERSEKPS